MSYLDNLQQIGFLTVYFLCSVGLFVVGHCAWLGFRQLRQQLSEVKEKDASQTGGAAK